MPHKKKADHVSKRNDTEFHRTST